MLTFVLNILWSCFSYEEMGVFFFGRKGGKFIDNEVQLQRIEQHKHPLNMEKSSQIYDSTINTEARFNKPKSTMELISLEARDN